MEPIQLTTQEFVVYTILANAVIGFVLGLVPLAFGFVKNQRKYAFFGLIACIVGGAVLGIFLSIPLAAIFTWLIFKSSNTKSNSSTGDDTDTSIS